MATPAPKPYLVTGVRIPGESPTTYPRLEIRELLKKPKQFTWFILGWFELHNSNYKIPAARFMSQGGIHGLPHAPWEGDPMGAVVGPDGEKGYCNHASVLFPTWHRLSILLLEQTISEAVNTILVPKYINQNTKDASEWIAAAKELRFPYWDWTHPDTGKEGLPEIFYQKPLWLELPDGTRGEIDNILAHFHFDGERPAGFENKFENYQDAQDPNINYSRMAYFHDWKSTYRWPSADQENPIEDYAELNKRLIGTSKKAVRAPWRELTGKIALLFTLPDTLPIKEQHPNVWDRFSNTRFQSALTDKEEKTDGALNWNCGSLEGTHNQVHSVLGGSGHMNDPDYAGFDPIFYLHHCNVDRILAYWEHVYPDYWMGDGQYWTPPHNENPGHFTDKGGKYGVHENSQVGSQTPLTPFRKGDGSYWTSEDSRWGTAGSKSMSYTYPPIPDPDHPDDPKKAVSLEPVDAATRKAQIEVLRRHFEHGFPVDKNKAYVVSIRHNDFAFYGSYTTEIMYTTPSGGLEYIGSAASFARSPNTQCAGCQARREMDVRSDHVVLIPNDIVDKIVSAWEGETLSKDPEDILKMALRAQIALPGEGGTVVASAKTRGISDDSPSRARDAGSSEVEAPVRLELKDDQKPKIQLHSKFVPRPPLLGSKPGAPSKSKERVPKEGAPDSIPPFSAPRWRNHGSVLDDWF